MRVRTLCAAPVRALRNRAATSDSVLEFMNFLLVYKLKNVKSVRRYEDKSALRRVDRSSKTGACSTCVYLNRVNFFHINAHTKCCCIKHAPLSTLARSAPNSRPAAVSSAVSMPRHVTSRNRFGRAACAPPSQD
ncbi:hypothetical protein EVAR_35559_1 [Eumeta japonica]|uniref:Uncharacterized protein n=1 Tax=Eumeta variegata TaxID=151549 RepID=A0A4C1XM28_EUMVA|nr:hypothetical protein EVAR_35559_1 [Eumeta japonica]